MLLAQAYEELEEGDFAQASEKGWGAAAQMLKAIAEERGWAHHSHRALHGVASRLCHETGDLELEEHFINASFLHVNFYENTYLQNFIERRIRRVERFVEKVEGLLGTPSGI